MQGFRTADPRAQLAEADFHAFENAAPSPFQLQQPDYVHRRPAYRPQAIQGGWAADFQRLNIAESPVPAGQFRTEAPLVRSTPGGWQNEFMRQRSGVSTPVAQGKAAVRDSQMNMNMNTNTFASQSQSAMMNYSQPMYQSYNGMYQNTGFQQQQQQQEMSMQQHVQMADVDFDAAFQEAYAHAQEMDQQLKGDEVMQPLETMIEQPQGIKIGSDTILQRERTERTADHDKRDSDALARTAGHLLSTVQDDMSTKFQNSQFLNLMRLIRDRQVQVRNNDLQDEKGQSASTLNNTVTGERLMADAQRASSAEPATSSSSKSHFDFPDMDAVYAPAASDLVDAFPLQGPRGPPYTTYGFEDDQHHYQPPEPAMQPQRQTDELHPGGRWYPEQSPPNNNREFDENARLERRISASDFEHLDESAGLARRFS